MIGEPAGLGWIFSGTAACELVLIGMLVVSILRPERRIWPPPGRASWQFRTVWALTVLAFLGHAAVAVMEGNALGLPALVRFGVGLPMCVFGFGLAFWAVVVMGWHRSSGLPGSLATRGPYRWSRNPQYVGDVLGLVGWAVVWGSGLALVLALLGSTSFLLAPFAEEPWLEERLGEEYREYRRRVGRYLGRRKG